MNLFKKQKDSYYVVTMANGMRRTIMAYVVVKNVQDNTWNFYSTQLNNAMVPGPHVVLPIDEVLEISNNGRVMPLGAYVFGSVCGVATGTVVTVLLRDSLTCAIKTPWLRNVVIAGTVVATAYGVGCAVSNVVSDAVIDFMDSTMTIGKGINDAIDRKFNKNKGGNDDGNEEVID